MKNLKVKDMSHKVCNCKTCETLREEPKIKIVKIPKGYVWIQSEKRGDKVAITFRKKV